MWPDESSWIKALTQDMQTMRGGLEGEIAARTALQAVEPMRDQLTCQIWPVVEKHLPEMTGTLLDVGCYGGWLYPYKIPVAEQSIIRKMSAGSLTEKIMNGGLGEADKRYLILRKAREMAAYDAGYLR